MKFVPFSIRFIKFSIFLLKLFYHVSLYICIYIFILYCFCFWFLISHLCVQISISQALRHLSALIQSALSFCVPHPVLCSTRLCLCFWSLVFFHTQPIYSYFVFLSAVSSSISRCVFLFEIFLVWRNIFVFYGTQIYVLIIIMIIIINFAETKLCLSGLCAVFTS